jgi:hypothetical protein
VRTSEVEVVERLAAVLGYHGPRAGSADDWVAGTVAREVADRVNALTAVPGPAWIAVAVLGAGDEAAAAD